MRLSNLATTILVFNYGGLKCLFSPNASNILNENNLRLSTEHNTLGPFRPWAESVRWVNIINTCMNINKRLFNVSPREHCEILKHLFMVFFRVASKVSAVLFLIVNWQRCIKVNLKLLHWGDLHIFVKLFVQFIINYSKTICRYLNELWVET